MIWAFCCGVFLTYAVLVHLMEKKYDNSVADSSPDRSRGVVEENSVRSVRWHTRHTPDMKFCPECGSVLQEARVHIGYDKETGKPITGIVKQCFATKFGGLMYKCRWSVGSEYDM